MKKKLKKLFLKEITLTEFSWANSRKRQQLRVDKLIKAMEKAGKGNQVSMLKSQKLKLAKIITDAK